MFYEDSCEAQIAKVRKGKFCPASLYFYFLRIKLFQLAPRSSAVSESRDIPAKDP